jgi:formate/nitrite transporter
MLNPHEIVQKSIDVSIAKANRSASALFVLGIFAGIFIAFGAQSSNMVAFNLLGAPETFGLGRMVAGLIFPVGLILTVILGAELWTGNCLMITGLAARKISLPAMLRNWAIAYVGNFVGSVFVALCLFYSGLFHAGGDALGGMTVRIAVTKAALGFPEAVILGILCNALVCLAVLMAFSSKSMPGKVIGIFLPIWLFVASGFEHSIANMYYIPAGLLAKTTDVFAAASGLDGAALAGLNLQNFFLGNLLPVTIGNFIGGSLLVGGLYYFANRK